MADSVFYYIGMWELGVAGERLNRSSEKSKTVPLWARAGEAGKRKLAA
jgi:hypothetical protein